MADRQAESLETGSEEITLSDAKFVSVRKIYLQIGKLNSNESYEYIKAVGIAQITSNKLVYFANIWHHPYDRSTENFKRTIVGFLPSTAQSRSIAVLCELKREIHAVASLSDDRIILSANDHLKIMSVVQNETGLTQLREINAYQCYDIACVLNKLVFAYKDGLGIWDISGIAGPVLNIKLPSITPPNGFKVCTAIEHGEGVIYVLSTPSLGSNLVTKLSLKGDVIRSYNNLEFTNAGGICASGDGHLFVSFPDENCIRVLVPDMSNAVTVIQKLNKPSAICYCQETRRLFVNCNNSDAMQVFEIK